LHAKFKSKIKNLAEIMESKCRVSSPNTILKVLKAKKYFFFSSVQKLIQIFILKIYFCYKIKHHPFSKYHNCFSHHRFKFEQYFSQQDQTNPLH